MIQMFEWINFIILIISTILFSLLYTLSTLPKKLSEKFGDRAWKLCSILRIIGSVFELVTSIAIILWIWFPIEEVDWKISSYWWIGFAIGLTIAIPGLVIMVIGLSDAGKESLVPSEETELYGGIYKFIRHPQTVGEMPLFVAFAFAVNSWFLVIITFAYIVVYIPIMLYFEEKDLIRRFGESYLNYRKETGALFPKFRVFLKK